MCKSERIILWMGGYTGAMYRCPDCGYVGPLVIETDNDAAHGIFEEDKKEQSPK